MVDRRLSPAYANQDVTLDLSLQVLTDAYRLSAVQVQEERELVRELFCCLKEHIIERVI
jgi:hypothetical protein